MKKYLFIITITAVFCAIAEAQAQGYQPRLEIGGSVGEIYRNDPRASSRNNTSFGPRLVYNKYFHSAEGPDLVLSLEGEINWFIRDERSAFINGGHPTQGQFGSKVGFRADNGGFFLKAHGGFMSFGNVIRDFPADSPPRLDRMTVPIFNWGGVVELYPARHLTVRFDIGRTHLFYPHATILGIDTPLSGKAFWQGNTGLMFTF